MAGDLLGRLNAWLAEARVDEAAAARARERWLRQAAEAGSSFAGVLLDLAERGTPVVVATEAGRRHRAVVRAVGSDFVGLGLTSGAEVLVRTAAVSWVRQEGRAERAVGDRGDEGSARPPGLLLTLGEALSVLAEDRPRVLVVPRAGDGVAGRLAAVGTDAVTLRLDGPERAVVHLPLATVTEVAATG